jgi:carbamoyltransferase
MQSVLNLKIKRRESFRPFAPIVLAERATDYFELSAESPYMLLTAPVRRERRLPLPDGAPACWNACTTCAPTSRRSPTSTIQPVCRQSIATSIPPARAAVGLRSPHRLRRPGQHVLHVRGEPPVCHPREALACFLATEMDCLALGPYFVDKKTLPPPLLAARPQLAFAPD